ncbi:MAG: S-methyl-5-thioribose-1-phosphate isomerase [Candidatus Anstonellales archaeon]
MSFKEIPELLPFFWKDNILYILDQRQLPFKKKYIKCTSYKDVVKCIKDMNIRGAPAIGLVGAYALVLAIKEADKKNIYDFIKLASQEIVASRPTAYNLSYCVNKLKKDIFSFYPSNNKDEIFREILKKANLLKEENKKNLLKIVEYGVKLIKKNSTILTHCNTGPLACGNVGTALGIIINAYYRKKINHVFVDETRPYLQGAKLTVLELDTAKVPYTLITDNMAAFVIKEKKVDCVIVGADRIARNGDTANKIGSYNLAILCRYHKIPFYVAAPFSSIDINIPSKEHIKIEFRSSKEVKYINDKLITLKQANVLHPAFDLTPACLITAIITERGIFKYPYDFSKVI